MNGLGSGDKEIRTLDPLLAKQVLYQLSYTPEKRCKDITKISIPQYLQRKNSFSVLPDASLKLPAADTVLVDIV